ncbi:MAG: undecaprenyl-phosphate glucose phosphotransferase [Bacteroidaceae bacterium]|nr:undecaprenyl-phosphate glucose phosphotransferase [Bacteroidaceae bacterium]
MRKIDIEESRLLKWVITLLDITLVSVCLAICYFFYATINPPVIKDVDLQVYLVVAILCYLPTPMIFPMILFERSARGDRVVERAFQIALIHIITMFSALFLLKQVAIARILLITFFFLFGGLLTLERLMILYSIRHFRSIGKNAQHVLFVGSVEEMKELYEHMQNKEFGYNVVGLFTDTDGNERIEGLETLGGADEAMAYLESHPYVNAVYCTMSHVSKDTVIALYKYCENNLIRFYVLPMYVGYLRRHMRVSHVGSTMLLSPRREPLRQFENRLLKRAVDFVVSALFLLTVFPIVYIVVAILIKRQSPGPIIFVQKRNGLNGKEFNCYKFRSMFVNGEADQTQATEDDERKFPFGDFMRRRNIDELPQFVNVLLGDMSLVGPRPHMLAHTEEYSRIVNKYMVRHWVKPGMTGWAQVNGFRGETRTVEQMEQRVKADIWYVENWNFWLDVRIIWRTIVNTMFHRDENAY